MKIGVLADIHGDAKSLLIALDILKGYGVDYILCAGDLIEKGEEGDQVIALIQEYGIISVLGNHDEYATDDQLRHHLSTNTNHPQHTTALLKDQTIHFLKSLPRKLDFQWEDTQVMIAHGTPWSNTTYLFSGSFQKLFERVTIEAQANIVILGHTHEPMLVYINKVWIFNPGSVCGSTAYGSSTCGLISLPEIQFQVIDLNTRQPIEILPLIR